MSEPTETPTPPPPSIEPELHRIRAAVPDAILGVEQKPETGHFWVTVRPRHLPAVVRTLRDDRTLGYAILMDLFGVDRPEEKERLQVYYQLYAPTRDRRLFLRVAVAEGERIPTLCELFPAANWPERETAELLGVRFEGHANLELLLLPDGFEGHPLRKDFPLVGRRPVLLFNSIRDLL